MNIICDRIFICSKLKHKRNDSNIKGSKSNINLYKTEVMHKNSETITIIMRTQSK